MGQPRGRTREHQVVDYYRQRGWAAYRIAHGPADAVALQSGRRPQLIQVKSTARGPYDHFPPEDRRALLEAAAHAGADPVLAWWPPRGQLALIREWNWPAL